MRLRARKCLLILIVSFLVPLSFVLAQVRKDVISSNFLIIPHRSFSVRFPLYSGKNFKKIEQAARDGFRILPVRGGVAELLMKKQDRVNESYSYKLFGAASGVKTAEELNEAAKGGFRLIPSTFILEPHSSRPTLPIPAFSNVIYAILEKPPIPVHCEYIAKSLSEHSLLKWAGEKSKAGFAVAVFDHGGLPWVLMEKCDGDGTPTQIAVGGQGTEYRVIGISQLEVDKIAAVGYKLVQSIGDGHLLFEKTENRPVNYRYTLVSLKSLGSLNDLAEEGYRLRPPMVTSQNSRIHGEFLVMELTPNHSETFQYEVRQAHDVPQLYKVLDEASDVNFRPVSIVGSNVILERNTPASE